MKKNSLLALIILLGFQACYKLEKPNKPEHLLSEQQMTNIILDLSIAAAAKGINKKKLDDLPILPREFVFKKHGIDSLIFANNNNYYSYDLDTYKGIYTAVKDSLAKLKKSSQEKSLIKIKKNKGLKIKGKKKLDPNFSNKRLLKKQIN